MEEQIKTGLVMEGGAMRGMFTAGVIDVFMENNIVFDGAIGVSAGATFGCNIKSRQVGRAIRYNKRLAGDKRYCSLRNLIRTGDMYEADFCYRRIPFELDLFDMQAYRTNPMKFYCVASDCVTGKPVYKELPLCDEHDLTWMRGSASMPLVSKIVEVDGYKLLDGGMTDSIPVKYFESIGYNKNVVILTQPRAFVKEPNKMIGLMRTIYKKYPELVNAMEHRHEVYNQETKYVFEKADAKEMIVICPEKPLGISRTEKNPEKLQWVYEQGRLVAKSHLEEVRIFLRK